jgi:nucleoside-diphosphate-sugar epimerase
MAMPMASRKRDFVYVADVVKVNMAFLDNAVFPAFTTWAPGARKASMSSRSRQ